MMDIQQLQERLELPADAFPSAETIRRAELKFACVREDNVRTYYDRMVAGEDLYMNELLAELAKDITDSALKGNTELEFQHSYVIDRPRSTTSIRKNEIYSDSIIKYSDGTYFSFNDWLDVMSYMHAICEFLFDYLTSDENGYEVDVRVHNHNRPHRPSQQPEPELNREGKIRAAFESSSIRDTGFALIIRWGDKDFEDAVKQMETISQYDSYIAGVPLSDILA